MLSLAKAALSMLSISGTVEVPEPQTYLLLGAGIAILLTLHKSKRH
jgi:hypothetical protein